MLLSMIKVYKFPLASPFWPLAANRPGGAVIISAV